MTITQDNYLDLFNLFVNELVGDPGLFILIGIVLITVVGVQKRLDLQPIILLNILFIGLTVSYVFNAFVWLLTLMLVGIVIYVTIPRMFKR